MFLILSNNQELAINCRASVTAFLNSHCDLFGDLKYAITPYLHILAHLPEIQTNLGCVIGFYQNSCMIEFHVPLFINQRN